MIIEQIYTGCLAQGAYYIQSGDEVAIIDPLREVQPYIEKAKRNDAKIKYIFETHFHADFVSGHIDLAKQTGAHIIFGPSAVTGFESIVAEDEQVFELGKSKIKVLHTPGHTLESSCFLLIDEDGTQKALFTGDTLFIGDVGRPDLAQNPKAALTQEKLAGMLYDSLHNKIMVLPDDIIIYPAHGAGSACGKNMSKETFDTLANQKQTNYALKATSKEQFVQEVTEGLLPPPYYFPENARLNKQGYDTLEEIKQRGLIAHTVEDFERIANQEGAIILDTRAPQTFKDGFIPKSINIGIKGGFAPWVGTMITDINQPILFVADEGMEEEVLTRLSRVGYDHTLGYLKGGFDTWKAASKEIDTIESITAEELASRYEEHQGAIIIQDVRKQSEYNAQHIDTAHNHPLSMLNKEMEAFDKEKTNYIHCAGGYRSMIACSILKARGYDNVVDIKGGYKAIANTSIPQGEFVCPSQS